MQGKKGTKPSEGYSSENFQPQVRQDSRPSNDPAGLNPTYTISTTKVSALGKEIDVVRTTNGHYVSRKMIEQLRANAQAGPPQAPAPAHRPVPEQPQPAPVLAQRSKEPSSQTPAARPRPGGPEAASYPQPGPAPDRFDRPAGNRSEEAYYNQDAYNQQPNNFAPRRDADTSRADFRSQDRSHAEHGQIDYRQSYDQSFDNSDRFANNEEYPQDTKNSNKISRKKSNKDKEPAKGSLAANDRSENRQKEGKKSSKDAHGDSYYNEQVEEFYGPYGVEKNYHSIGGQPPQQPSADQDRYEDQSFRRKPDYDGYPDQHNTDTYRPHDYDESYYQSSKGSNFTKDKHSTKAEKRPNYIPKNNSSSKDQNDRRNASYHQGTDEYVPKQKDTQGGSQAYNPAYQPTNNAKSHGGQFQTGQKALNVNSPPVDFEMLDQLSPGDNQGFGAGRPNFESPGLGSKGNARDNGSQLPANPAKGGDAREPSLLTDISAIVKSIKKFEDSCKELELIYRSSGLDLKNQLSYDYATFSRNCLNIVRSLLNEVSSKEKDRSKDKNTLVRKQIDKLKGSISDNQGQVDFLMSLEHKAEQGQQGQPVAQVSSLIPASLAYALAPGQQAAMPLSLAVPGPHLYPGPIAVPMVTNYIQTELIKKNLQSGAYGSYIMNPYMLQQAAPSNMFGLPSQQVPYQNLDTYNQYNYENNYGEMYPVQTPQQAEAYQQQALSAPQQVSQPHAFALPEGPAIPPFAPQLAARDPQAQGDAGLEHGNGPESESNLYPSFGGEFPLYGVGGGLFGPLAKATTLASSLKPALSDQAKSQTAPQENYKSLFSLFTNPPKPQTNAKPDDELGDREESYSQGNLQFYSDEEDQGEQQKDDSACEKEEQVGELPRSLQDLLDEDSGEDSKSKQKPQSQEPELPINDISEIIPTENRFIHDSHIKDFTLIDDGKPEDESIPSHIEIKYQFGKGVFSKEGQPSTSRKEALVADKAVSNHRTKTEKIPQTEISQPKVILARRKNSKEKTDYNRKADKGKNDNGKPVAEIPQEEGSNASYSKRESIRADAKNKKNELSKDNSQSQSQHDLEKDSLGSRASQAHIDPKQSTPESSSISKVTMKASGNPGGRREERSFDGQPLTHENQPYSSQQAALDLDGAPRDHNPVYSTSNHRPGDSNNPEKTRIGQNRDPRVAEDQDLAVPTGNLSTAVAPAGDRDSDRRQPKRGQSQKDGQSTKEGKDSHGTPLDVKREMLRDPAPTTFLNDHQLKRLLDIGNRATNKIFDMVSKILDGYADSRQRRKEKRSEDSFFTESENPNGLTIYELCTSSEYSACVQRKLSRLKEAERIELFYLMKPHLIRLLMDGLGKYVVHGMISMSNFLLFRCKDHYFGTFSIFCTELPCYLQK